MHELVLGGCHPVPLAHYLKALGVLRLVAEQRDPSVRGYWRNERFVLCTDLDQRALERFFLEEYRPTPIVAPWNGGSGFYPKDNTSAIDSLAASSAARFAEYRETITVARTVLRELEITEKTSDETKATLLERCRATFPDHSLRWLDATYVLLADGPKYPPLLGTGGNDGRLDFTNNFMQRVLCLADPHTGGSLTVAAGLLHAALFETPTKEMLKGAPIGQFLPSQAGGANASSGYGADSLINPWDFVLTLEGATAFAAATVRRMERDDRGALSYPFTVKSVGVGYASASKGDETSARAEIWLPLWSRPAASSEIQALLSEGRARVGSRAAQNGLDFARAVSSLGVDRGVEAFQRYGFHMRNGRTYFAVPIGRLAVRNEPRAARLQDIDAWLESFRWRANSQNAPAAAPRALRRLEDAIFELCAHGDNLRLQRVLIALGECEQVMATSTRWTDENRVQPVPALSPAWLPQVDDGTVELRLAAALASVFGRYGSSTGEGPLIPLRRQLEPVTIWKGEFGLRVRWDFDAGRDVVWTAGHLADAMNAVMRRRLVLAVQAGAQTSPDRGRLTASLSDIAAFIEGRVDDQRLMALLWGCILLDWTRFGRDHHLAKSADPSVLPGAFYALLKCCFGGLSRRSSLERELSGSARVDVDIDVPIVPSIHRAASAGQGAVASKEAIRRLRGSGLVPAVTTFEVRRDAARRTAAALLFHLDDRDRGRLWRSIATPDRSTKVSDAERTTTLDGART